MTENWFQATLFHLAPSQLRLRSEAEEQEEQRAETDPSALLALVALAALAEVVQIFPLVRTAPAETQGPPEGEAAAVEPGGSNLRSTSMAQLLPLAAAAAAVVVRAPVTLAEEVEREEPVLEARSREALADWTCRAHKETLEILEMAAQAPPAEQGESFS